MGWAFVDAEVPLFVRFVNALSGDAQTRSDDLSFVSRASRILGASRLQAGAGIGGD